MRDEEEKDMSIAEAQISDKLQELKHRAMERKNSGKYRKELTEKQKEYYLENCKDLEYEQFKTIKDN